MNLFVHIHAHVHSCRTCTCTHTATCPCCYLVIMHVWNVNVSVFVFMRLWPWNPHLVFTWYIADSSWQMSLRQYLQMWWFRLHGTGTSVRHGGQRYIKTSLPCWLKKEKIINIVPHVVVRWALAVDGCNHGLGSPSLLGSQVCFWLG